MYQLTQTNSIIRLADNALIPNDPANRDYAKYLDWIALGNTPQPADLVPNPRIVEIKARLAQIDIESVRSIRSKLSNRGQPADDQKLTALDDEAAALRTELATLPALV